MENIFKKSRIKSLNEVSPDTINFIHMLEEHESTIYRMAISPNGRILASPSNDCTVKLWDLDRGECLHTLEHLEAVLCVAWSPDGMILTSGGDGNNIKIWDTSTGRQIETIIVEDSILEMAWSPNGKILSFCSEENGIFLYKIQLDLQIIEQIYFFDENCLYFGLSWSPCGEYLSFSSEHGSFFLLDINTFEIDESIPKQIAYEAPANYCSAWSPNGRYMAVGSADRTIKIINMKHNVDEFILEGHTASVVCVTFLDNGRFLSSLGRDGTFLVWLTDNWSEVLRLESSWNSGDNSNFAAHPTLPILALRDDSHSTINIFQLDFSLLLDAGSDSHTISYVNAKAVLLGESGSGKSGLGIRLAEGEFRHTEGSTHGAQFWHFSTDQIGFLHKEIQAELTLWDLAGQPEYRLTHQLFLDHSDAILLLFDCSDSCNPFRGVTYWSKAIKKHASPQVQKFLVSSRCDVSPVTVDQKEINQALSSYDLDKYFKTSAATGEGVADLFKQLINGIPWLKLPCTSTPRLFKTLREFLLECKKDDINLISMDKVRQAAEVLDGSIPPSQEELKTLIRLLKNDGERLVTENELNTIDSIVGRLLVPTISQEQLDNIIWLLLSSGSSTISKEEVEDIGRLLLRYGMDLLPDKEKPVLFKLLLKHGGYGINDIEIDTIVKLLIRLSKDQDFVTQKELIPIIRSLLNHGKNSASKKELGAVVGLLKSHDRFAVSQKKVDTIVRLLQNRGLVYHLVPKENEEWVLLKPELINQYGGSIIHAARNNQIGVGAVNERDVLIGEILFTGFERLHRTEEFFVLYATVELFIKHDLCFREMGYLVFPSQINVTRLQPKDVFPRTEVSYRFSGSIETIYASLVVRLSYTDYFHREDQWKYAAEFSCSGKHLGFTMKQIEEGTGELEIYFYAGISEFDRVTFIRFITDHLRSKGIDIDEQIKLFCSNCSKEVLNPEAIEIRIQNNFLDINCLYCDTKILIPKSIEERYQGDLSLTQKQRQLAKNVKERTASEVERFRSDQHNYDSTEDRIIHILHISDLHIENASQAEVYKTQIELDLQKELKIKQLSYLVISGDIANKSTEKEYRAAFSMIDHVVKRFGLDASRVVVAPGNHDLNWDLSEAAYSFIPIRKCPTNLPENQYISHGKHGALLRDDKLYTKRFASFNEHFYRRIYPGEIYPLEPENQFSFIEKPKEKILFLSLNSCWEIDHHYLSRASINMQALSKAFDKFQKANYRGWLKIAVWHHPVTGKETMNTDFMQLLAVNKFQLCLHGHIHEAIEGFHKYDKDRGIIIIGAGTFGASTKDLVPGIPLQYNLLSFDSMNGRLTVTTRKKEKPNGAWAADARWGSKNHPDPFYTIDIPCLRN